VPDEVVTAARGALTATEVEAVGGGVAELVATTRREVPEPIDEGTDVVLDRERVRLALEVLQEEAAGACPGSLSKLVARQQ